MKIEQGIREKLQAELTPAHLEVVNESNMHNVPPGSESHFKLVIASEMFAGLPRVRRHQKVYGLLSEELQGGVHALALHTYSVEEWKQRGEAPASPQCMGGSKA